MSPSPPALATLSPAPVRRWITTLTLLALAVLFLTMGSNQGNAAFLLRLLTGLFGLSGLYLAVMSFRYRRMGLVLTPEGIYDSQGRMLTAIGEIVKVDRGHFALKPSNGFVLTLKSRAQAGWVPGLWWRMGRRIGIGGTTVPAENRFMADQIALLLGARGLCPG